jgi:tRNA dimethylallyltransferase
MNKIIVIGGPTASGKTALAIRCATQMGTEIISADSRQCYTEMTIGTAKPTREELESVPHHFISSHQLPFRVNAGTYIEYAKPILERLLNEKGSAVIAGGTGFYIKALLEGLDEFPEIPDEIRAKLNKESKESGSLELHQQELKRKDPDWFGQADIQNHRRILRALEVIRTSSLPYSSFLAKAKVSWNADIRYFYPNPDRQQLYDRIEQRVLGMMVAGLEEEVRNLSQWESHPALQTVGYREFFPYFRGEYSREDAIKKIIQHTRNYAKRQWTWFRNQGQWLALDPDSETFKSGQLDD